MTGAIREALWAAERKRAEGAVLSSLREAGGQLRRGDLLPRAVAAGGGNGHKISAALSRLQLAGKLEAPGPVFPSQIIRLAGRPAEGEASP